MRDIKLNGRQVAFLLTLRDGDCGVGNVGPFRFIAVRNVDGSSVEIAVSALGYNTRISLLMSRIHHEAARDLCRYIHGRIVTQIVY